MKKYSLFIFLFVAISSIANAQTITATGMVKDSLGDPLHFAFVQDKQEKTGAFTDSLGNFTIQVNPNGILRINCAGYKEAEVNVGNKTNFSIVLNFLPGVTVNGVVTESAQRQILKSTFNDAINLQAGSQFDASAGAIIPVFQPKEETVGSRYLLKGWVHGYVINSKDSIVQNPNFQFEYDKMGGGLLLTKDKTSAIEIDRDLVKSFTLYDNANVPYTFENVPQIDKTHYVEVVASGNKYKIYKAIKTNFEKSNYTTDGLSSTGNNYDEYVDEKTYYVYNVQTNALQKITLKKKVLKDTFAKDGDKINKFMSDHSSDTIDDTYLSSLGSYMNE